MARIKREGAPLLLALIDDGVLNPYVALRALDWPIDEQVEHALVDLSSPQQLRVLQALPEPHEPSITRSAVLRRIGVKQSTVVEANIFARLLQRPANAGS